MIEKILGGLFIMLVAVTIIYFIIGVKVILNRTLLCETEDITVVSIGVCAQHGLCSVRLSDGSIALVYLPVVGLNKNVCVIRD